MKNWIASLAIWPDPFDQLDDRLSSEEQSVGLTAEAQSPQRRTHDKPKTQERNEEWQQAIDALAKEHPKKSHADLCRMLEKKTGTNWQTIRRNTKLRHS